jgi:hypothetical protein
VQTDGRTAQLAAAKTIEGRRSDGRIGGEVGRRREREREWKKSRKTTVGRGMGGFKDKTGQRQRHGEQETGEGNSRGRGRKERPPVEPEPEPERPSHTDHITTPDPDHRSFLLAHHITPRRKPKEVLR